MTDAGATERARFASDANAQGVQATARLLFAGTYTDGGESEGVYTLRFDERAGTLGVVGTCGGPPNPSFVVREGDRLYAAHERADCGCLASYAVDGDGSLALTGACAFPREAGTCFALFHSPTRCLYGANYESGSLGGCTVTPYGDVGAALPVVRHEGCGPDAARQASAHVHTLSFVPGTRLLAAVDLGSDEIVLRRTSAFGHVAPQPVETVRTAAGSGPRMVAYHPRLPLAAVVDELACDVSLFGFDAQGLRWTAAGRLELLDGSPSEGRPLAAHIAFSPDGGFLYVSVRGTDRIVAFPLDVHGTVEGRASFSAGGRGPRHFSLSRDGRRLAVADQGSGTVVVFGIDPDGAIAEIARTQVPAASCVIWG